MKKQDFYELLVAAGYMKSKSHLLVYRRKLGLDGWHVEDIPLYIEISNRPKVAWNKGIPRTNEEKKKMSESHKGKPVWNKGKKGLYSETARRKISEAGKGRKAWNKGIPRTNEEKKKMSIATSKRIQEGKNRGRYKIDTVFFDSSWEVYFYIYCIHQGCTIQRNIRYKLRDGRYTLIDFLVDGQLIEVKGPQFFNKKGEYINPYNNPEKIQSPHYAAKQHCWQVHKVRVITDITIYKEWCDSHCIDIQLFRI